MNNIVRAFLANLLAWLGGFLLSWLVYAQFDPVIGRAGIYAWSVTSCGILMILHASQPGEWLYELDLRTSAFALAGTLFVFMTKGWVELLLIGRSTPTVANIQLALEKSSSWGMQLTLALTIIFVTGFFMSTLRLLFRRQLGLDK